MIPKQEIKNFVKSIFTDTFLANISSEYLSSNEYLLRLSIVSAVGKKYATNCSPDSSMTPLIMAWDIISS